MERLDENNSICHDCVDDILRFWWRMVTVVEPG
jgi:hypothetical protein